MFLRYLILICFVVHIAFQSIFYTYASSETVFTSPIFGDISGTALQGGGVLDSYPIAGNTLIVLIGIVLKGECF